MGRRFIRVEGARQNNLKDISVRVPVGAVTAVTGVAGAGKSSLAFDVLHAEGYRRYVETFSPYARQFLERFDRPRANRIDGVLPSVAIDRTAPVRTSRSTVGTMTSVADYLRALYARSATLHCRQCGDPVQRDSPSTIFRALVERARGRAALLCSPARVGKVKPAALREVFAQAGFRRVLEGRRAVPLSQARLEPEDGRILVVVDRLEIDPARRQRIVDSLETALRAGQGQVALYLDGEEEPLRFSEGLHCPRCDIAYADSTPALFSFNNPVGACETCKGFGRTMDIDPDLVVPDPRLSVAEGCVKPFQTPSYQECQDDLLAFLKRRRISAGVPWKDLDPPLKQLVWNGEPGGREPWQTKWYGIQGFFEWLHSRTYRMHVRVFLSRYRRYLPCPDCGGARLKPPALLFRIGGRTLPEIEALPIREAEPLLRDWSPPVKDAAASLLLREIRGRLRFLRDVGLDYLTLSRQSRTLSGGEAQRVTLATALGSSLTSTLYVLDEPSVGLHARDAGRLSLVLTRLASAGNAVVVVEHDRTLISAADQIIDLGPGPGRAGGWVVYQGPLAGLLGVRQSETGRWLAGRMRVPAPAHRRQPDPARRLQIEGARENNLRDLTVDLPLGLLVCVTGVSGSGKSTLVDQVLYRNLRRAKGLSEAEPGACRSLIGAELISGAVLVDQAPLGRSSRVNAATYIGALGPIREAFAASPEARHRGLRPSAFSFNSAAGACPHCSGAGYEKVELQFLPDAYVKCPGCDGRRYRPEVLEVKCRDHDIASLLDLPASEVARIFADELQVKRALQPLLDIGLGYLSLSQPAPTLSGGEVQRLKLAAHLAYAGEQPNLLFILDEPTTGLHAKDVSALLSALHRMVDQGHSVVVVEHNAEVARSADWILDLGPEGGEDGGRLVAAGTPEEIARLETPTGEEVMLLAPLVRQRKGVHKDVVTAAARRGVRQVRIDGILHKAARPPRLDRFRLHDVEAMVERVGMGAGRLGRIRSAVERALDLGGGAVIAAARGHADRSYSTRRACPRCGSGLPVPDPRLFTWNQRFGACPICQGLGDEPGSRESGRAVPCSACAGTRLRPEALSVKIGGRSIGEVAALSVREARAWLRALSPKSASEVTERVLPELSNRLALFDELGLGYLTLDRSTDTLSTGEGQRVRVVAQLAGCLRGVCYVLDEPTVGLHPRDGQALSRALFRLRQQGNTVVVVEHDESVIRAADHVVDLGPGAGPDGGRVVAAGSPSTVARTPGSVTGRWLRGAGERPIWPRRPLANAPRLLVKGAQLHNLRGLDVEFPLGRLICVTGPSGSGKSTLVRDVVYPSLRSRLAGERSPAVAGDLQGWQGKVVRVLEVDESPIGRTPRSVPATYVGMMAGIRDLFAASPDARARGYGAGRFSFNLKGGRCDKCEGQGRLRVTMSLLPEVYIPCESCAGRRYNADTLAVTLKGKSIAGVLSMTVDQARDFLEPFPALRRSLEFLSEIGLGYLQLGQASPTLSGGEAQRIKLAAELATPGWGRSVYLLDEPTTGLHMADVAKLVNALHRLVDRGDAVIVIEHNLEVIAAADCVIDLGPGGGAAGGRVVAWGIPEEVAQERGSRTAPFLRSFLRRAARGRRRAALVSTRSLSLSTEAANIAMR